MRIDHAALPDALSGAKLTANDDLGWRGELAAQANLCELSRRRTAPRPPRAHQRDARTHTTLRNADRTVRANSRLRRFMRGDLQTRCDKERRSWPAASPARTVRAEKGGLPTARS